MIIRRERIGKWLSALKDYTIFAPAEERDVTRFVRIDGPYDMIPLSGRTSVPPKEILFPETQCMFRFTTGRDASIHGPPELAEKTIIFGISPCDARAFTLLDRVFDGDDPKDPYYLERRRNTVLVGLGCSSPSANCFCTSLGGGPFSKDELDILLTDLGDRYYADVVTERGRELVEEHSRLFDACTPKDAAERERRVEEAEKALKRKMDTGDLPDRLDKGFDSDIWGRLAMKCLGCRACTFLCPTCHCFDIQDEVRARQGRRVRVWDSCMVPEYSLHASGHNPRPARMNRLRNRVYHKFKYFPDNFDTWGCVGCGRCIDICPVNMDIITIIESVAEVENE